MSLSSDVCDEVARSPFFYVGDKFKLIKEIKSHFPKRINRYFEPFCGGGSSFLNVKAKRYFLNDIDKNIIGLHKFVNSQKREWFFDEIFKLVDFYGFSCSFKNFVPPKTLKEQFKKTYFAKFNKASYENLRRDFNENQEDMFKLYLLLIYGFNHMIRFNQKGKFNLPVGNVDFNKNVVSALENYFDFVKTKELEFSNLDFGDFLRNFEFKKDDFVYCDPPYLISNSEYNKFWGEKEEKRLYDVLEILDQNGVLWGVSNLLFHKGKTNLILQKFMVKYQNYRIKSNYISFNDNSVKNSVEVFVTNAKE